MPNDRKQLAIDKIDKILEKLPINEAIEAYQKCGENLHAKIEKQKQELIEQQNKLGK